MANVINYLKWRGDLTFDESLFNEVDNLVLSLVVYSDLKGIVPEYMSGGSIKVKDAAAAFFEKHDPKYMSRIEYDWVLYYMAKSRRFSDLLLSDFMDINDMSQNMLVTAMTVRLPDGRRYVSYRGTGYDIDDWRMDFMISFQEIPAQKEALNYLSNVMQKYSGDFLVGGHSKGGNLALYASMNISDTLQIRIKQIYSNDGPGICSEFLDEERFENIRLRLTHIVPEFCIVGMLFEPNVRHIIIGSEAKGIAQHTGMTWQVDGNHFKRKKHLNENSVMYNSIIDDWIESNSMEQREIFTKDIFDSLKAGGATSIQDIQDGGMHGFGTILLSMANSESKTKIVFGKFISTFWGRFEKLRFMETIKSQQGIISLSLIFLGLLFFAIPENVYNLLGALIAFVGIIWSGSFLIKSGMREENGVLKRGRMIFWMVIMCFMVFLLSNLERIPTWTNVLVAVAFVVLAATSVRYVIKNRKTMSLLARFWMIFVAVIALNVGVIMFMSPMNLSIRKSITVGSYLVITGLVRLLIQLLGEAKRGVEKGFCYEEEDV
ncbi:Mbeg1-like protein [Butyrivibrio sp. AE3006]|uniref:Mbeg1-like protein n=1 Tax=Butyrivibrio sp. AE3006 TaxID=1280673 RepID=UPI00041E3968|nr:Mbeg1-like protein [Butyrivibrio sp. AE3006]